MGRDRRPAGRSCDGSGRDGVLRRGGDPLGLIYSFIGYVAQQFILRIGIEVPGGVLLGALVHFLLGLTLGSAFGLAVSRIRRLRLGSVLKGALLGVLYIEIVSQPILVSAPLLVKMTTPDVIQWYVLSTSMHTIYGIVLGVVLALRQRRLARPNQGVNGRSAASV